MNRLRPFREDGVIYFPLKKEWIAFAPSAGKMLKLTIPTETNKRKVVRLLNPRPPEVPPRYRVLTLFLTTDCTLRCVYCYGFGGERKSYLDWDIIKIAIDFYFAQNPPFPQITFHGGGEPTLCSDMIKKTIEYVAHKKGVSIKKNTFAIGTNGIINHKFLDWLILKKFSFSISYDGLPEIQDQQRPLRSGKPTAHIVEKTIKKVSESGNLYCISCTITKDSVEYMPKIVEHVKKLGVNNLWMHCAFPAGRCPISGEMLPPYSRFYQKMRESEKKARILGIKIGRTDLFCSLTIRCAMAPLSAITITTDGYVTGCLEVCTKNSEFSDAFILGKVNRDQKTINFYEDEINKFRSRTVDKMDGCAQCFVQDICSGGCPIHCLRVAGSIYKRDRPWCALKKRDTLSILGRIAEVTFS